MIVPSLIFLFVMVLFLRSEAVMLPSLMSLPVIYLAAVAAPAEPAKAIAVTIAMGARYLRDSGMMGLPSEVVSPT